MSEILEQLSKKKEDRVMEPQEETQQHEIAAAPEGEDESEAKIRIGDKEFKTQEEAFAYAQSLEQKTTLVEAQSNAYRQAIQDTALAQANAQKVTQAPPEPEEDFDAKFYENPKEYLKTYGEKISREAEERILNQINTKSEEERLWGEFFSSNQDLRDFKEDCEGVLAKHTDDIRAIHQTKGQKAAMDYLAQKTRAKFQNYIESTKPQRELSRTSAGASMGSAGSVTRNIKESGPVDFITEIRQARGKRG
jgi:hypothetical protein